MNQFNMILLLIVVWLGVFCESAFGGTGRWFGTQIDLLPPLIVYASLTAGVATVALLAVVGGLLFDSLSSNPLGVTILPLFMAGLFIYLKRDLVLREQISTQLALGAAASTFVPLASFLILSNVERQDAAPSWRDDSGPAIPLLGSQLLWQLLVLAMAGALCTPLFFKFFDGCYRLFNYQPLAESSFRPDREIKRSRF